MAAPSVTAVSPNVVSYGSTFGLFTITGSGFTGATGVNFGGSAAASFTVVSDTEVTAFGPTGGLGLAGSVVDVTVLNSSGTSAASSADQITVAAISYPPGEISLYGQNQALTNQETWITYIGVDGSVWHLSGPGAPVAGAQDGVVLIKFMGLYSPFQMLEQRGARQDGATWQAAVYDVGEIMMSIEASGITPQNIRNTLRQWVSAWDARGTGVLDVFTPDMGEWWANVRMGKNISDMFEHDYTWSGRQVLTWEAKNYDAVWYSVDSTCSWPFTQQATVDFTKLSDSTGLTGFTQVYTTMSAGSSGVQNGAAVFIPPTGGTTQATSVINISDTQSETDYQVISVTFADSTLANLWQDFIGATDNGATLDIWARVNSNGTSGVKLSLGYNTFTLYSINSGTSTTLYQGDYLPILWGETYTLIAGVPSDTVANVDLTAPTAREFRLLQDGRVLMDYTDTASVTPLGAENDGMGFGQTTFYNGSTLQVPLPISGWSGYDNQAQTIQGFVSLTNRGDLPTWPRYLCYGPGTFSFGNGPGSTSMITFGPLLDGQIVLVTTEPQYRSVVDLSPNQPPQVLNQFQTLIQNLISFATNNNTPPLLQQFESALGIQPPQGNLYSLLNGRFTNPVPGSPYGVPPQTQQIAVSIEGATPNSRIIASITPMRRWPL